MLDKNQEMKIVVNELVKQLKAQGVNVDSAAILNIPGKSNPIKDDIIDATVKNIFNKMKAQGFTGVPDGGVVKAPVQKMEGEFVKRQQENVQAANQEDAPGQCYCPDCFNFDTFESVLEKRGGKFDYGNVQLNGKTFQLKYWTDGKNENIMISPEKYAVDPAWTIQECQEALNVAVTKKDYDTAQVLLNRITELKNQN